MPTIDPAREYNSRADAAHVAAESLDATDVKKPRVYGIRCPRCDGSKWRTPSVRKLTNRVVRVRVCVACRHRISTKEVIQSASVGV